MQIKGRWRIVEMELWDEGAIELLGPAFIEISADGHGSFRFIAVEGWMDAIARSNELTVGAAILTGIKAKLIDALEA